MVHRNLTKIILILTTMSIFAAVSCKNDVTVTGKTEDKQEEKKEEEGKDSKKPWPESGMEDKTYITNGKVQIGIDLTRGGSIFHFSDAVRKQNALNHADAGRFVQQSYYGSSDGSNWNGTPWSYNPIQGGGYKPDCYAKVVSCNLQGDHARVVTTPMHWATCQLLEECSMTEDITLDGNMAHIRYSFSYNGTKTHGSTHQEMPAVFIDWTLGTLVYYNGTSPWKDGALTRAEVPSATTTAGINKYLQGTSWSEKWAAYVGNDGWGVGAYSPSTTLCTYYRFGSGSSTGPKGGDCSYFSPLDSFALTPGMNKSYDVYLYLGTAEEIRAAFKAIAVKK